MESHRAIEKSHAEKLEKKNVSYRKRMSSCTEPMPEAPIVILKLRMCVTETQKRIMNE